ncbi:HD-GYP domain-containing protein [Marinobacter sp.]|uniref:HD-GYP domain-containing protein n=1 Tax=Marinobacter sp. TaxID=50741 RepID=UPI00384EF99D
MSKHVRVAPGALIVGKPLPWTVYDSEGQVLLRQGYVIQNEMQLEQLFERGLFQPREIGREAAPGVVGDDRDRNPFTDYPMLLQSLEAVLKAINSKDPSALKRLTGLTRLLDRICQEAPDPCLALVHLYSVEPTAYEQTLFYAIICHFVAEQLKLDEKRRVLLMGAALTANLALLPFLDKLNSSRKRLSEEQRLVIRKHPLLSTKALEEAGIGNPRLLKIIEQHHEHHDGSGYPAGLRDEDILTEARILALAERYTAMITQRAYRERLSVAEAMEAIHEAFRDQPRPEIYRALLKALTRYPPGSLVRLANNEVAVVVHRPVRHRDHIVQAIIGPTGNRYMGAFKRDCGLLEFNIRALEDVDVLPPMDFGLFWGFR